MSEIHINWTACLFYQYGMILGYPPSTFFIHALLCSVFLHFIPAYLIAFLIIRRNTSTLVVHHAIP
jgi:hypothetical protein